jgi:phosphate-selective porin OprO and OprP
MRVRYLPLIAIFVIVSLGSLAVAQTSADSDAASMQKRVQQLEQLVNSLQQKMNEMEAASGKQAPQPPAAATPAKPDAPDSKLPLAQSASKETAKPKEPAPIVTAGRSGFTISSADKAYRLRFAGQFQLDGKFFYGDNAFYGVITHQLINNFQIRKARPILDGSLGQYIDFRFVPDFGSGKAVLFDAYADIKASPYAVFRAGKFKTPLGLQQLQGDGDLPFIERSLVTDLVPNRSQGVQLSGSIQGRVTYQAAVTNGAPVGQSVDNATNRGKDIATRIFLTPFTSSKVFQGLGFGAAATTGRQEGGVLPSLNTTGGQIPFFTYGYISGPTTVIPRAAGHRQNFSPQMYYYYGPFGFMTEYAQSTQKVTAVIGGNTVAQDISNHAWQTEGTWVITGEKKSFKSVIPNKGLEGGKQGKGFGAWELAARYSALRVDPTAFTAKFADPAKSAQVARNWAIGLNWYMNYFVKFAFDYEQTQFVGGAAPSGAGLPVNNRSTEKVFMQRLQLVF